MQAQWDYWQTYSDATPHRTWRSSHRNEFHTQPLRKTQGNAHQDSDRAYRYTAMVRHAGVLVAFALDSDRQIFYTVLDRENEPEPIEVQNWLATPQLLVFPKEIARVGLATSPNKSLPLVRNNGEPARHISEIDKFLATTARLTADAPFQVVSDNQYIYLFRQAISANHEDMVSVMNENGEDIPIVDRTLLCDRFMLSGTELKTVREVRYRRSRHQVLPDGSKDSLGTVDMNNLPFDEPTLELDFVRDISLGRFTVALVPTSVPDLQRWQIFVHNQRTDRIDSYNIERSATGLFNTQGAESSAAFGKMGYAESALKLDSETHIATKAQLTNRQEFNISLWIRLESTGIIYAEGESETIFSIGIVETEAKNLKGYGVEIFSTDGNTAKTVSSLPNVVRFGQWHYLSVSLTPDIKVNNASVTIQLDDAVVHQADRLWLPFPATKETKVKAYLGKNIAEPAKPLAVTVDELSIWDRARSRLELLNNQNFRKTGEEPGLITYWQFEEGNGETIYDRTDTINNGIIKGKTQWISDPPLDDSAGIHRSSFGFAGRTIAGKSITALLYHQQEAKFLGDDRRNALTRQNARMLLAVATQAEAEAEAKIATIDFAITRRGLLAQIPDEIDLHKNGNPALPMPSIHIDPNGLNVVGGLLDFAQMQDAPQLFESADGMVRLYCRGDRDQFFSATYDNNVSRASLTLSDVVELEERFPGLIRNRQEDIDENDENPQGTKVKVSDGVGADTCTVTLTNSNLNLTETWQRVPRNSAGMGRVLSGQAREAKYLGSLAEDLNGAIEIITLSQPAARRYDIGASVIVAEQKIALGKPIEPGDKVITVTKTKLSEVRSSSPVAIIEYDYDRNSQFDNQGKVLRTSYDLKYGSVLVKLIWMNDGSVANITPTPLTGLSRPNAWLSDFSINRKICLK